MVLNILESLSGPRRVKPGNEWLHPVPYHYAAHPCATTPTPPASGGHLKPVKGGIYPSGLTQNREGSVFYRITGEDCPSPGDPGDRAGRGGCRPAAAAAKPRQRRLPGLCLRDAGPDRVKGMTKKGFSGFCRFTIKLRNPGADTVAMICPPSLL